jgi:hypothetical protein
MTLIANSIFEISDKMKQRIIKGYLIEKDMGGATDFELQGEDFMGFFIGDFHYIIDFSLVEHDDDPSCLPPCVYKMERYDEATETAWTSVVKDKEIIKKLMARYHKVISD